MELTSTPLDSKSTPYSTSAGSQGMPAGNSTMPGAVANRSQNGASNSDGWTSAGAPSGGRASLALSDQRKGDIDVSLWTISFKELSLLSLVGKGSFGRVYEAEWAHHTTVAVKVLDGAWPELAGVQDASTIKGAALPSTVLEKLQQEASLLAALRHPNVVAFLGLVNSPPCLVTEFCPRGSLYDMLQEARKSPALASQLTWSVRINMALDAARGMTYLHSLHPPILHRDLKSSNLLVCDNWAIKVADFSVSKIWLENAVPSSGTEIGNPRWLAPEVLSGDSYTPASDVFSFAVVLWELLTWELPWADCGKWQVSAAVVEGGRPAIPSPEALPGEASSCKGLPAFLQLIERCWAQNPQERPCFADIVGELRRFLRASLDETALQGGGLAVPTDEVSLYRSRESGQLNQEPQGANQEVLKRVELFRRRELSPFQPE